jgi:hypothetical protein
MDTSVDTIRVLKAYNDEEGEHETAYCDTSDTLISKVE